MNHKVAFSFADGKTAFFDARPDEVLLDAALRNGIQIPLDCREGVCGTCQGRCDAGLYTQDYVDEEALSAADLAQRRVLSCQTRVQSDASFSFDFASSLCGAAGTERLSGRVAGVRRVSETTAILRVDAAEQARRLEFLPGQYARVKVPGTDAWRAYSCANRPNDANQLTFLIRLLPDGAMSSYIRERCEAGQPIAFEAPFGAFYLRQVERPLVMVAGGTGLSALLGMLDELAARGGCGQPVHLYYGVTHARDLCELERIEAYATGIPGFSHDSARRMPQASGLMRLLAVGLLTWLIAPSQAHASELTITASYKGSVTKTDGQFTNTTPQSGICANFPDACPTNYFSILFPWGGNTTESMGKKVLNPAYTAPEDQMYLKFDSTPKPITITSSNGASGKVDLAIDSIGFSNDPEASGGYPSAQYYGVPGGNNCRSVITPIMSGSTAYAPC